MGGSHVYHPQDSLALISCQTWHVYGVFFTHWMTDMLTEILLISYVHVHLWLQSPYTVLTFPVFYKKAAMLAHHTLNAILLCSGNVFHNDFNFCRYQYFSIFKFEMCKVSFGQTYIIIMLSYS